MGERGLEVEGVMAWFIEFCFHLLGGGHEERVSGWEIIVIIRYSTALMNFSLSYSFP